MQDLELLVSTKFYPSENTEAEPSLSGRFRLYKMLDAAKSNKFGEKIYKEAVHCEIKVNRESNKDVVSHPVVDGQADGEALKKRFASAWARFVELRGHPERQKDEPLSADDDMEIGVDGATPIDPQETETGKKKQKAAKK